MAFGLLETWGYLSLLYPDLPWRITWPVGVDERLAAMALALGQTKGREFIDSFPFEHHLRLTLHETLDLAASDKSPRVPPSPLALVAVRRAVRLPPAALKVCFLGGADLIKMGLKPGPQFHAILDEAARLQRLGKLTNKERARAWLKRQLKV
jgi:hypothetical protein